MFIFLKLLNYLNFAYFELLDIMVDGVSVSDNIQAEAPKY